MGTENVYERERLREKKYAGSRPPCRVGNLCVVRDRLARASQGSRVWPHWVYYGARVAAAACIAGDERQSPANSMSERADLAN